MFKKLSLIALVLIGATGAYALVANLFPNTVSFPRIPMGPGTIGEMLGQLLGTTDIEGSDGTVQNTLALSGVSASGYLQNGVCTNGSEVWLSVDANGKPVCGVKGALLAFGTLTDIAGTVTVNGTPVGSVPLALNVGDIVATAPGSSASIGFTTDNSVVRLDSDTSVTLQARAIKHLL